MAYAPHHLGEGGGAFSGDNHRKGGYTPKKELYLRSGKVLTLVGVIKCSLPRDSDFQRCQSLAAQNQIK